MNHKLINDVLFKVLDFTLSLMINGRLKAFSLKPMKAATKKNIPATQ